MIVDRFSKITHFIPYKVSYIAMRVTNLIFKNVVRYHGIPCSITFDRDVIL